VDRHRRPGEGGRAVSAVIVLIIAIILGFVVLKFVFGIIKFVLIAVIILAAIGWIAKKVR
jgi:hypothetical protein